MIEVDGSRGVMMKQLPERPARCGQDKEFLMQRKDWQAGYSSEERTVPELRRGLVEMKSCGDRWLGVT